MADLDLRIENKKLEEAARFWARGGKHSGPDAEDDLALFGVRDEDAKQWVGDKTDQPEEFLVFEENWQTVQVFLAMHRQWNFGVGLKGVIRLGMKFEALPSVFQYMRVPRKARSEVFAGLRLMESAALAELNKE